MKRFYNLKAWSLLIFLPLISFSYLLLQVAAARYCCIRDNMFSLCCLNFTFFMSFNRNLQTSTAFYRTVKLLYRSTQILGSLKLYVFGVCIHSKENVKKLPL